MGITRSHCVRWVFILFLSFIIPLMSHSWVLAHWTEVIPPTVSQNWDLYGVHFTSADEGWAVGWDGANSLGVLLHYQGGVWTSVEPPLVSENWDLYGVHFTSADEGWAVGWDGANSLGVLLHYQGGVWTSVAPPALNNPNAELFGWGLNAVHFTSADEGWAVGDIDGYGGAVLLHYQGGVWTSVAPLDGNRLYGVHFTSADEGWVVGYEGPGFDYGILLQYQGGVWTSVEPPLVSEDMWLYGVHFTSADEGWAVGWDVLLHYQGGTWTSVAPPDVGEPLRLNGVHLSSAGDGWAVGYEILLHYQGGTWTSVEPPLAGENWGLNAVHFTSADEGWAVGSDFESSRGVLLHYILRHVSIDIKPGRVLNRINLKSKAVSVAILSAEGFYAPDDVNQATLTFGFTGDELSFKSCSSKPKDVNGDGLKDLVCTFTTVKTAFKCSDTSNYTRGILRGQTNAEPPIPFEGYQNVATSPSSSCAP